MRNVFLIGPGGAGKTTCGRLVAQKLSLGFVDLDTEFMTRIGNIDSYFDKFGYEDYFRSNSSLFGRILAETTQPCVCALSSGFMTYPDKVVLAHNRELIAGNGISICLMPSEDFSECVSIIMERQLGRGLGLNAESQKRTIEKRFWIYKDLGDYHIYSKDTPEAISDMIVSVVRLAEVS